MPTLARSTAVALAIATLAFVAFGPHRPARAATSRPGTAPTRIMALGDSITHGYPTAAGYRQGLADRLRWAGMAFDFVGSQSYGPPLFNDREHEGHGGFRIDQIRAGTRRWLASSQPDVVLVMIGTNDFLGNYDTDRAPARLARLVDTISVARPSASVLVASIPPITGKWCDCGARVSAYNAAVGAIVEQKQRAGYPVAFVDMSAVTTFDLADGIHPSEAGHAKIADAWQRAIVRLLPSPRTPGPTPTPDAGGYWLVGADGGVFSFGTARFHGSTGAIALRRPIVGMAPTPSGEGYWLVASDGGVFAFGDARFYGSTGAIALNRPIVGIAATPSGGGYWFVGSDGGIFAFGDAGFAGSTGGVPLGAPIVAMVATPTGDGYWYVASDGGIFSFGDAPYLGAGVGRVSSPVVGLATTRTGQGYVVTTQSGEVRSFGDAVHHGSAPARPRHPVVGAHAVG